MKMLKIGNRLIGENFPPLFIADIGSNHNGDMELAKKLIDKAKDVGIDVAKFQSFNTENLISQSLYDKHRSYPGDEHRHFGSLYEMVKKYQLTPKQHKDLSSYCKKKKIIFASTPLSNDSIDLLDELGVPFFKIASMDVTNHPLLEHVSKLGKPILLSTGMATLWEIDQAMEIFNRANATVILLHCIAAYPPITEEINLKNIKMLKKTFGVAVGFSDHSIGVSLSLAGIAMGACIIEKHFTLDKKMPGWDHAISCDPTEFKYLIDEGLKIHKALGDYQRSVYPSEIEKRKEFRRSIVASRNLKKGEKINIKDLSFKRPEEGGMSPAIYKTLIGRTLKRNITYDHQIKLDDLI